MGEGRGAEIEQRRTEQGEKEKKEERRGERGDSTVYSSIAKMVAGIARKLIVSNNKAEITLKSNS